MVNWYKLTLARAGQALENPLYLFPSYRVAQRNNRRLGRINQNLREKIGELEQKTVELEENLAAKTSELEYEISDAKDQAERTAREEFPKRLAELGRKMVQDLEAVNSKANDQINHARGQEQAAKMALGYARDTIKDLTSGRLFIPLLRFQEKELGMGIYFDNNLAPRYATPALLSAASLSEHTLIGSIQADQIAAKTLKDGQLIRISKYDLEFGGKKYHVHQNSHVIRDETGNTIGTFVHITSLDRSLFERIKELATGNKVNKQYRAVQNLVRSMQRGATLVQPKID